MNDQPKEQRHCLSDDRIKRLAITGGPRIKVAQKVATVEHETRIKAGWIPPTELNNAVKQARKEVAREIFEAIESSSTRQATNMYGISLSRSQLSSIKARYLNPALQGTPAEPLMDALEQGKPGKVRITEPAKEKE